MTLIVKALLVLCSLGGAACSISIPVTMSSRGETRTRSRRSLNEGGDVEENDRGKNYVTAEDDEDIEEETLDFEGLMNKIKTKFQQEGSNTSNILWSHLHWKNGLKEKLETKEDTTQKGQVEEQSWDSCSLGEVQQETFCGYLKLKKESNEYKLLLIHSNSEGQIVVVKDSETAISYYRNNVWVQVSKETEVVDFDLLNTFKNRDSGSGYKVLKELEEKKS